MKRLNDPKEHRNLKRAVLGLAVGLGVFGLAACGEPPDNGAPPPGDAPAAPPPATD